MDDVDEIKRILRTCLAREPHRWDEARCAALLDAADRGDLPSIHDILVESMIEQDGLSATAQLLKDTDERFDAITQSGRVLH